MDLKYTYVVTLRNEKAKAIDQVSFWIAAVSAVAFLSQLITRGFDYFSLFGCIFVTAGLLWNIYQQRIRHERATYSRILLIAGFVWWITHPFPITLLGTPIIILGLIEKQVKLPIEIGFTTNQIVINTLIRKKFNWQDFNNIMLKDGMLTLDFRNNTLYQKETIDDGDDTAEEEFNDYCKVQLRLAKGSQAFY